jgi:predicted MPP superfamily phosphohydrolase
MFGFGLLLGLTLLQLYVLWRAWSVPWLAKRVSRKVLVGAAAALWLLFVLGRFLGRGASGALGVALELVGMDWLVVTFLTAVCLLAVELVTGFGFLLPKVAPRLRGGALLAGIALSVIAVVQGERPPAVQDYEVRLPGLPAELDGKVVVVLSDVHLGALLGPSWLEARVAQVQALQPDAVVLLGDVVEGHGRAPEELLPALRRLSAPLGVWAVAGNHESHGGEVANVGLLEQAGIQLLHDRWTELRPGLVLAGVDDLTARRRSGQGGDAIARALSARPPGGTILLSHSPLQAEQAARAGAGLMLSGHTHGGQIWPFGYLVARVYPLLAGRYQIEGMTILVSRGTGTWGPRMRLWSRSEILRVTLKAS